MAGFRLHHPVEDEWELVRDLRERAVLDTPIAYLETVADVRARSEDQWRERIRGHGPHSVQLVAIADDGTWVASMVVFLSDGPPEYAGGSGAGEPRANLVGVFVDPAWRGGAGVADAMVAELARWTAGRGIPALHLHVAADNPRAARAYEKRGFAPTGIRVQVEGGRGGDEIEMMLPL
jgi:ribosomal protein S18 acetylase RimI-like enzyme